jgi:hypothetical protein
VRSFVLGDPGEEECAGFPSGEVGGVRFPWSSIRFAFGSAGDVPASGIYHDKNGPSLQDIGWQNLFLVLAVYSRGQQNKQRY